MDADAIDKEDAHAAEAKGIDRHRKPPPKRQQRLAGQAGRRRRQGVRGEGGERFSSGIEHPAVHGVQRLPQEAEEGLHHPR
jgi:hypothetical protein